MLPILRTISVGGVFLAITILALALSPPGGSHMRLTMESPAARGALQAQADHPEWRQFLIHAAVRRANELNGLRDLPESLSERYDVAPDDVRTGPSMESLRAPPKGAIHTVGLPATRSDADPEELTGSIEMAPSGTIPIEIGEPSSTELPMRPAEEMPPVIKAPLSVSPESTEPAAADASADEPVKPPTRVRVKNAQPHRGKASAQPATQTSTPAEEKVPPPFNLLQVLFESLLSKPAEKPAAGPKPRVKTAKRTAAIRASAQ